MQQLDQLWTERATEGAVDQIIETLEARLADGEDFEICWRLTRAFWWKAEGASDDQTRTALAKQGMAHGRKAATLDAARIEGHFWLVAAMGEYSLGISILKALAEGLEGEFRKHCEASYKIDKTYEGGAPARAFGRFWFKLPWPKRNLKKSLRLLQEAVALGPKRVMNHLFLGETLMAIGKKADGRKEVELVLSSEDLDPEEAPDVPRYRKQAESVLAEL